jgi:hypothetical protein
MDGDWKQKAHFANSHLALTGARTQVRGRENFLAAAAWLANVKNGSNPEKKVEFACENSKASPL